MQPTMEDKFDNLKAHTNIIALTAEEKSAGREMLASFMSLTPIRTEQAAAPARFAFVHLPHVGRAASVFVASFALLVSAGGVSLAAERALPGDALYTVKVSFNEPVRAAMTVFEASQANWDTELASRRLSEAEQLASLGRLDEATRISLDAGFLKHSEDAQVHVAKIKEAQGAGAAADLSTRIESTLRAHRQIMDAIAADRRGKRTAKNGAVAVNASVDQAEDEGDDEDDNDRQVAALSASVGDEADNTARKRGSAEDRESADAVSKSAELAKGRRIAAQNVLTVVRRWLNDKADDLTADSSAQAFARLDAAETAMIEGDAAADADNYYGAFDAYVKAQRLAQEARLIAHVSSELRVRVPYMSGTPAPVTKGDDEADDSGDGDGQNGSRFPRVGGGIRFER